MFKREFLYKKFKESIMVKRYSYSYYFNKEKLRVKITKKKKMRKILATREKRSKTIF